MGTPSHIGSIPPGVSVEPDADVRSEGTLDLETDGLDLTALVGRNNEHDSRVVPPSSGHQRSNTSGTSAPIPGHSDATCGCALPPNDETDVNPPPAIHHQEVPSNAANQQLGPNASGFFPTEKLLEDGERDDAGTSAQQPTEIPLEHASDGGHIGEDAHDYVRSEKSSGKRQ